MEEWGHPPLFSAFSYLCLFYCTSQSVCFSFCLPPSSSRLWVWPDFFRRADQGRLSLLVHLLTHLARPSLRPGSRHSPARFLSVPRWPWNKELQSVGPHGAVQGAADRYIIFQSYSSLCTPALLGRSRGSLEAGKSVCLARRGWQSICCTLCA